MTRPAPLDVTVTRFVPAQPAAVYDLITDVSRMGDFSPETVAAHWLDAAAGPAVGARFAGTNAVGWLRWTTRPVVTEADPGRRFAFRVPLMARSTWTYAFEPVPGGTLVTESVRAERLMPAMISFMLRRVGVADRAAHVRAGMVTTLARLAAAAVAIDDHVELV